MDEHLLHIHSVGHSKKNKKKERKKETVVYRSVVRLHHTGIAHQMMKFRGTSVEFSNVYPPHISSQ
jgi:hypothetical protein